GAAAARHRGRPARRALHPAQRDALPGGAGAELLPGQWLPAEDRLPQRPDRHGADADRPGAGGVAAAGDGAAGGPGPGQGVPAAGRRQADADAGGGLAPPPLPQPGGGALFGGAAGAVRRGERVTGTSPALRLPVEVGLLLGLVGGVAALVLLDEAGRPLGLAG